MKLIKAHFKNLFSIGEVKLNLSQRGLVLITGESLDEGGANGSGKSSISSKGIIWSLYGTTSGGLKAGNVVNRHGGKSATGEVEFEDSEGNKWLIRRQRPQKLELFKNGENVSSKDTKETQKSIDSAIGMTLATFVQTAYFGQGRPQAYAGLTAKDQKALLEQILPMEEIEAWAKYAGIQAKALKGEKEDAYAAEVNCHAIVNERQVSLKTLKRDSEAWESTHLTKLNDLMHQKEIAEQGLNERRQRLEWTKEQLDEIDMDTLAAEQIVLEDAIEEAEEARLGVEMIFRNAVEVHSQWNKKEYDLQKKIDELKASLVCPTCERGYGPEQEALIAVKISTLEEMRADAIQDMLESDKAKTYYADAMQEALNFKNRVEAEQLATVRQMEEAVRWGNVIDQIEREIREAVMPINIRIEEAEKEQTPYIGMLAAREEGLTHAQTAWTEAVEKLTKLNDEIDHLQYWEKVYSKELKLKMFEECCSFLDNATTVHLKGLRNEQFKVKFSTIKRLANGEAKDEFAATVESVTGGGNFESLSGGEQQMVSFAIGLALADLASCKTASKPEFLILDEPFSELDERNSEAIVDYLTSDFGINKDTLLLISNEVSLQGLIPERIHVIKQGGISNVDNNL